MKRKRDTGFLCCVLALCLALALSGCAGKDENVAMRVYRGQEKTPLLTVTWDDKAELEAVTRILGYTEETARPDRPCDYLLEAINKERDGSPFPTTWLQLWVEGDQVIVYSEDTGNDMAFGPGISSEENAVELLLGVLPQAEAGK